MGKSCGLRSTGGKSLADFAGTPQRADPVYNRCPLIQSGAHVYSFWHQGQEADRSVFTENPQFSQRHANKQHCHDARRQPNTPSRGLPVLITNSPELAYMYRLNVFKLQRLQSWKFADVTFESQTSASQKAFVISVMPPVSPFEVPGREYCFPRTHNILNSRTAMMKATNFQRYESN